MAFRRPARWPTLTALAIALIGLAVGLVGWFRPTPHNDQASAPSKRTYTNQQTADAKAHMCTAFENVDHALSVAEGLGGSSDPTAILAVAISTRQVLDFGSRYLAIKLAEEPATPSDLATAVRKQSNAYQELMIRYLDGRHYGDPELQPAANASEEATATIRRLCK